MRHEENGTVELLQQLLERLSRGDIEVVGRLVEDQEVRILEQQDGQCQARPLATGEASDRLEDIVLAEQKASEVVPGRFLAHRLGVEHHRERCASGRELLMRLRVVADFDVDAGLETALQRRDLTDQCLEQGRFAGAVRSNQADSVAPLNQQVLRSDQDVLAAVRPKSDGERP